MIRGQGEDGVTAGTLEAGHQRGRFAEAARETDDREVAAVDSRGEQRLQIARDVRLRAVHHNDDLVRLPQSIQSHAVFCNEGRDVICVASADRDDHGHHGIG